MKSTHLPLPTRKCTPKLTSSMTTPQDSSEESITDIIKLLEGYGAITSRSMLDIIFMSSQSLEIVESRLANIDKAISTLDFTVHMTLHEKGVEIRQSILKTITQNSGKRHPVTVSRTDLPALDDASFTVLRGIRVDAKLVADMSLSKLVMALVKVPVLVLA